MPIAERKNGRLPSGRDDKLLLFYFKEASRAPLLTADEERVLGQRIKAGDRDAHQQLARHNLRLVIAVAKEFRGRGLSRADLIQEGNVGLMRAASKFDIAYDCRFSTYAKWWIKQAIRRAIEHQPPMIRIKDKGLENLAVLRKASREFEIKNNRPATAAELAGVLSVTPKKIERLLAQARRRVLSFASAQDEEETFDPADAVNPSPLEHAMLLEQEALLERELAAFREDVRMVAGGKRHGQRDALVFLTYYGLLNGSFQPTRLVDAGRQVGLGGKRAQQIVVAIWNKLDQLEPYTGAARMWLRRRVSMLLQRTP